MASSFQSALFKAKRKHRTPAPANPPMGTYDPAIDAQGRQLQRGYDDLLQDFNIGKTRASDDLSIALGNLDTSKTQTLEDLSLSRTRNLADLLTGDQRTQENHDAAIAGLQRKYGILANQQGQAARRANVESAGILAQALAKRTANQAYEQQPIDQSLSRALEDSNLQRSRMEEDYTRDTGRVGTDASQRSDALKLAFDRAFGPSGDNVIRIGRAGRDLVAGQSDLNAQKWYGATANGYVPPARIPRRKTRRQVIV